MNNEWTRVTVTLFCHWVFFGMETVGLLIMPKCVAKGYGHGKKRKQIHANTVELVWLASARLDDLSLHNFLIELLTCLKRGIELCYEFYGWRGCGFYVGKRLSREFI